MAETKERQAGAKVVLLAEDNEDEIILLKRAFSRAGITHKLRIVRDGAGVVTYLMGRGKYSDRKEYPLPVLLLLDLKMPGMNGFEVLAWVRAQPELKELRVIVLTSSEDPNDMRRAYELGANSFMVKSCDLQKFVGQLEDVKERWL